MELITTSGFHPTREEHYVLGVHYKQEQPWRSVKIDLTTVVSAAQDVLATIGYTEIPQIVQPSREWPRYSFLPHLPFACFCGVEIRGLCHPHDVCCDMMDTGLKKAWWGLIAAHYGTDAPFRSPSPWRASCRTLQALRQFGYSYEQALTRLGIDADLFWFDRYLKYTWDSYTFGLDRTMYTRNPDWITHDLRAAREWRERQSIEVPASLQPILSAAEQSWPPQ